MGSKPTFNKARESVKVHRDRTIRVELPRVATNGPGVTTLLMKYAGGKEALQKFRAIEEQIAHHPETENSELLQYDLMARWYAEHAVTGWENVYGDDGTPAEFSPENLLALLSAIACPDAADQFVRLQRCTDRNEFRDPLPTPQSVGKG